MIRHVDTQTVETERLLLCRFEYPDIDSMLRNRIADEQTQWDYKEPYYPTPKAVKDEGKMVDSILKPDHESKKTKKDHCVIFDMDGVIFDSERACLDTWTEAAAEYGITNVMDVFYKCIGTNKNQTRQIVEEAYAAACGEGIADKILSKSSRLFHEKFDGGKLPIKRGVWEILEYIKSEHIRCAIASSTRKVVVEAELRDAGLIDYFEEIIGGDAVKISKPNPEIYLIACDRMRVDPSEAFAVEDSYNGVRAANAAGMRTIMVPDMIPADNEMKELSEVICDDLLKAIEYLKAIKERVNS